MIINYPQEAHYEVLFSLEPDGTTLVLSFKAGTNLRTNELFMGECPRDKIPAVAEWTVANETRIWTIAQSASSSENVQKGCSWIRDWNVLQRQFQEVVRA